MSITVEYMTSMIRTAPRARVATLLADWETHRISKYEFYGETICHTPKLIAEVTGIDIDVIKDRRRYLRQLASA
jgi:hypothetical protein